MATKHKFRGGFRFEFNPKGDRAQVGVATLQFRTSFCNPNIAINFQQGLGKLQLTATKQTAITVKWKLCACRAEVILLANTTSARIDWLCKHFGNESVTEVPLC